MAAAVLLERGTVCEQQEGQEVCRPSREDRSGKRIPVSLVAEGAETAMSQLPGKTHRRRNWSSARRTCAKARVSNRGKRDICRVESACDPGRDARELNLGSRGIPQVAAVVVVTSLLAVTVGSQTAYVDLRQPKPGC